MELIKEKTCCFTGHRALASEEVRPLRIRIREEVTRLYEERGIDTFLAGGALGFDTLAAEEVLLLRGGGMPIHLVLVLPCLEQADRWTSLDNDVYQRLIRDADEVIYTGDLYTPGCMHIRNRYMVGRSVYCLCYYKGRKRGGTAYTVGYALKQGLEIKNLVEGVVLDGTAADQMSWG